MVFSSNIFLLYFLPIFLLLYFLTPKKFRNYTLLLFSLIFYAYGAPDFFFLLVFSTVSNFFIVKAMYKSEKKLRKKILCGVSIALNLSLLLYFKYGNFFMENLNAILGFLHRPEIGWARIALPIGISFFTFQSITYTLDTYRSVNKPMNKLTDYVLYIMMFPQLIAGPIIRYCDIADQIRSRQALMTDRLQGFYRFVLGLSKKVLIADIIGFYVDKALAISDYSMMDSSTAWITILAYTFQLYFDFAGYSDMAIGLGRMMGFKFPENFDNPYVSTSISEFWRRWHMTFSIFMKNYLYFPLGGSRVKTKRRLYFNLWFVFLLSGLWHGASWNFVVYGIIQGVFIVMDRLFLVKFMSKLGRIPSVMVTFLIIVLARVFFRIEDIGMAWTFMQRLFAFDFVSVDIMQNLQYYVTIAIAAFFSFITLSKFGLKLQDKVYFTELKTKGHILFWIVSIIAFVFCLASLNATGFSPFIYFRF
ncbi:hypothetical protein LJC25_02500 [Bacteroidales bacterium OttesenSCG-928-K03]|nr:MBOAT family protein [Bacteroidales bacterium OttesenSCG-928-L14]MDL2242579.1 hypothetical protein [Bacteroidales bacterium OttesenSCG-928-K03]